VSARIDVQEIERKSFRYIEQDGLIEIFTGLIFIGTGALFRIHLNFVVALIAVFLFPRFIEKIRSRFTYSRIGYAKLPQDDPKKSARGMLVFTLSVAAVFVICLILFGDVTDPALYRKWCPTVFAMILLGAFIYLHSKSGEAGPWVYALVTIGLGLLFSILDFDGYEGTIYWCLSVGVFFMIAGLSRFVLFLRKYPRPAEEASDGKE
jgi:hypothetical protein